MMIKSAMAFAIILILSITVCGCTNSATNTGIGTTTVQELQSPAPGSAKEPITPPVANGNTSGTLEKKILVAYFSHSGNTRVIANQIQKGTGGDIFEIKTVDPYPQDYEAVKAKAMQELTDGYRPPLAVKVENLKSYDVIFLGYPIWWGTTPMAVESFLSENDLSGKTIIPFCTHEGSGLGSSVRDIKTISPQSTVMDGLAIRGGSVNTAQNQVSSWLRGIGYLRNGT